MEEINLNLETINKIRHYFADDELEPLGENFVSIINRTLNQEYDTEEKRKKFNETIESILMYERLNSIFRL